MGLLPEPSTPSLTESSAYILKCRGVTDTLPQGLGPWFLRNPGLPPALVSIAVCPSKETPVEIYHEQTRALKAA